jgi:O-antigen biosynthesis protein WbqP
VYPTLKRLIDIAGSLLGLVALSPLFVLVALAVRLDSRGPAIFRQKRVGIHQQYFDILKFRTMRADAPQDTPTHLLEDPDSHTTRIGRFLRRSSLDELPQLLNILGGSMSLVGPRPALWNQYDLIEERERYGANDVRPGLTGWAQIHGRDELCIQEKARLDGEYVRNMSLSMDAKCIVATIRAVLRSEGFVEGASESQYAFKDGEESSGPERR